uniref:Putative bromo adjacent homology (BAH) domain, zinc finger, RING/FYVE/PHD-type n=1 Tax=Tanacetum cinerariifolium TaxID=118510 RepID=A0A6L2KRH7_TANCI|nr:putative bromo adjacent homology (BAH) domain, zinc finger, RING/FYVE/PHD-type [Tanacetum cinerariifolium]
MREDEEDIEWVGDNFGKISETCTVVKKNEGTISNSMHDVEWVRDKLNEADGKTYYQSCCINGTTYELQHYALFSSTGKNLVPGKLHEIWEDSKTNKKWVTVRRYFFPDDLPERLHLEENNTNLLDITGLDQLEQQLNSFLQQVKIRIKNLYQALDTACCVGSDKTLILAEIYRYLDGGDSLHSTKDDECIGSEDYDQIEDFVEARDDV